MAITPDADAIVLFVGLAGPEDIKAPVDGHGKPQLILVSNYEPSEEALLRKGIIELAIMPRADANAEEDKAIHSEKEWFEQHYQVLTPERLN